MNHTEIREALEAGKNFVCAGTTLFLKRVNETPFYEVHQNNCVSGEKKKLKETFAVLFNTGILIIDLYWHKSNRTPYTALKLKETIGAS